MPREKKGKNKIDYLRLSITDRCNLRCFYCMPQEGVDLLPHDEMLTYEEIVKLVKAAAKVGISKIRITGGEPLVRKDAVECVRMLASIDPGIAIVLTTNGVLLEELAGDLKRAGLDRVNISIDSLDPDVYEEITRGGDLGRALKGLDAALEAGLEPVKINTVVMSGINQDLSPFARLVREKPVHVRFIEFMPYFGNTRAEHFVSMEEMKKSLRVEGSLERTEVPTGWGPAEYHRVPGAIGTFGFISPMSAHFCGRCNRLRLSANGFLRTCLFERDGRDVKDLLRAGVADDRLVEIFREAKERKATDRRPGTPFKKSDYSMSQIGG